MCLFFCNRLSGAGTFEKSDWLTIPQNGTARKAEILDFLDMRYDLTNGQIEEGMG